MKGVEINMAKEIRYVKPNMANLKGKLGRSIINQIRNAKRPDRSEMQEIAEKTKLDMLAKRKRC